LYGLKILFHFVPEKRTFTHVIPQEFRFSPEVSTDVKFLKTTGLNFLHKIHMSKL